MDISVVRQELRNKFRKYYKNKEYQRASEIGKSLTRLHRSGREPYDWHYFDDLYNLGLVSQKLGRIDEAMTYYSDSYSLNRESFGENYGLTYPLNNMAILHAENGDYEKAIELYGEQITILKTLGRHNTKEYYDTLYNIGNCYSEINKFEDAAKALGAVCKYYVYNINMEAAHTFCNMAYALENLERYKEAAEYMEKSVLISKQAANDNEELNRSTFYLAGLLYKSGEYIKSLEYYRVLLKSILKSQGGATYYPTCLNQIAEVLEALGNVEEALDVRYEALAQIKIGIGCAHLSYANSLRSLAIAYKSVKNYRRAIELLGEATKVKEQLLGCEETCLKDMVQLVGLYILNGQQDEAIGLIMKLLEVMGKEPESFDEIIQELAKLYINIGDINQLNKIYNSYLSEL